MVRLKNLKSENGLEQAHNMKMDMKRDFFCGVCSFFWKLGSV